MKQIILLISFTAALFSCTDKRKGVGIVSAYVPVYVNSPDVKVITWQTPQAIVNGGKIATIGNKLYQVETDKGIHIIDITNPSAPIKIGFIKNNLCRELTLKGNYIYTNNLTDLVVLDVSIANSVTVTSRVGNAFPDLALQYPPHTNCYFECADASKGIVLQWNLQQVDNPKCKR
ncbi:MAG: hypothetical protein ABL929_05160 [Ferruginibacter sp.]|nr:hypothetical protein [Ferruginibacter sp.]